MTSAKKSTRAKKPKLMSEYEQDLTWMAYRYAIGRHTIAASSMSKQMAKNVYGRMTRERSEFTAKDIQKEIEMKLRFYPFSFRLDPSTISCNSDKFVPIDRFIEYLIDNGNVNELDTINSITCEWNEQEKKYEYYVVGNEEKGYTTSDWIDLMEWSDLAKLLDYGCHKFCIATNPDTNEDVLIEYFETYRITSYKTLSFEKVKVPCKQFSNNAYIMTRIEESYIKKDDLSEKEVAEYVADTASTIN